MTENIKIFTEILEFKNMCNLYVEENVEKTEKFMCNLVQICTMCGCETVLSPSNVYRCMFISGCFSCDSMYALGAGEEWHIQSVELPRLDFTISSGEEWSRWQSFCDFMGLCTLGLFTRDTLGSPSPESIHYERELDELSNFVANPSDSWHKIVKYVWSCKDSVLNRIYRTSHNAPIISNFISIPHHLRDQVSLIEDILILLWNLYKSKSMMERQMAIITFCKLRNMPISASDAIWLTFINYIVGSSSSSEWEAQVLDFEHSFSFSDCIKDARLMMEKWNIISKSKLYTKLYSFGVYLLASGLLDNVNITFNSLKFTKFEEKCARDAHKPGMNMIASLLDTILFVCERGNQYFKTGDIYCLFSTGNGYDDWVLKAHDLVRKATFLSNPEPHGFDRFSYLADLKSSIEQGSTIIKFTSELERSEKLMLQRLLNELKMLEANEITKREALKPREDPFAIIIHGSSSIAKSQLKQIMFYHFGKVFKLPTDPEYLYTRNPFSDFWDGFNSTQWAINLDDVAFMKPNGGEIDPTLREMLQIKNSVPYVPNQASLEDKGRTPVRAKLLIGTTNTLHLNLPAYFACPFAIARRFNYYVTVEVKKEFANDHNMLDPNAVPITPNGEYMNIWNFDVAVAIPHTDEPCDNMHSRFKLIASFTDINDFVAWYASVAHQHTVNQSKSSAADVTMREVVICDKCFRPETACNCTVFVEQSSEDPINELYTHNKLYYWYYFNLVSHRSLIVNAQIYFLAQLILEPQAILILLMCFYSMPSFLVFIFGIVGLTMIWSNLWIGLAWFYRVWYGPFWKIRILRKIFVHDSDIYLYLFKSAQNRINDSSTTVRMKYLAAFISSTSVLYALKGAYELYFSQFNQQASEGVVPQPRSDEKTPHYYHDPYKITDMDISCQSKTAQGNVLSKKIEKNIANFCFSWKNGRKTATQALNIYGNVWMFNKHVVKDDFADLRVTFDDWNRNISRNVPLMKISKDDMLFIKDTDFVFIQLRQIPPGASLVKYFPLSHIKNVHKGTYFMISMEGDRTTKPVMAVQLGLCPIFGNQACYLGKVNQPTKKGDCGAPLLVEVGSSQVIFGIHCAGDDGDSVAALAVTQSLLDIVVKYYGQVPSSTHVRIDEPSVPRTVGQVHEKSVLRWVTNGTAKIGGTFSGFRTQPKSKVVDNMLRPLVKDDYPCDMGKPNMSWRPFKVAIDDMVKPNHVYYDRDIRVCEDAFYNDIESALLDQFYQLEVYTQNVALNGVAGVTYVDRINTSTSAGLPFRGPKKKLLIMDDTTKEIVGVVPELQRRIDEMLDVYSNNERFHALFCGHLKDDPLPQKKIDACKTRLFTGGECAYAINTRRFFLSHIRLMQNNPFVFEAMPGIVAQSHEWTQLYEYVTDFGPSQIVAGDYGKFDKKMAAPFIISAYNILIRMAQKAGWKEEDLTVLRSIAYDTAFPTIDFNGDLIEIQGNPSGHPLTVIINCLVNSLYMRYAFMLTTGLDPTHFKKYVRLATYGDDNLMGVCSTLPKFNHTAIARALDSIGVEYTMADKESESVPYIHISQASFLKRLFVFDEDVGAYLAPLDENSIAKMLNKRVDNGDMAAEAHAICTIETAVREYFFYGRERFEDRRTYFQNLVRRADLCKWERPSTFPSWETLVDDFWSRSGKDEKQGVNLINPEGKVQQDLTMCDGLTSLLTL